MFTKIDLTKLGPPIKIHRFRGQPRDFTKEELQKVNNGKTKTTKR